MLSIFFVVFFTCVLVAHCIGDFWFQTRWMGTTKHKDILALSAHVLTYFLTLTGCTYLLFAFYHVFNFNATHTDRLPAFLVINAVLHLITDAITSRITAYFKSERGYSDKGFFTTIGVDQMIHSITLFISSTWCFGII